MSAFQLLAEGIGESLRNVRRHRRMTQSDLAGTSGIAQADISHIERGTRNPSFRTLARLADGLGCQLVIGFREETDNDDE